MATGFEALLGALWAEIGLGAAPRGSATARLTVDGQLVSLALSPDEGSVVVTADLGPLDQDSVRLDDQLRRLLRDGAGLALRHAAAVKVTRSADDTRHAVIEAVCPCRRDGTAALSQAIEDVLAAAGTHRATVSGLPRPTAVPAPLPDHHLIFRL